MSSAAGGALFDGWEFRQYLVASQWLRDHDIWDSLEGRNADLLMGIKLEWEARFEYAPLNGPMQVYNPVVDRDLRFNMTVLWLHVTSGSSHDREWLQTATHVWSKRT